MTIWNERYNQEDYAFGTAPNVYFRSIIDTLKPGRLLVPGAGEGRDAVYAAKLGWQVDAFDLSVVGKEKALRLAENQRVSIHYQVQDVAHFDIDRSKYDLVAMIFLHLPTDLRREFFGRLHQCLHPGGLVVLEAFNPLQIPLTSGGPKDPAMLLTPEILRSELMNIDPIENFQARIVLNEGLLHQGVAEVVRYLGRGQGIVDRG
jgi:SAM-dependent methyltransferase